MEHLRFPVGKFEKPEYITEEHISAWTQTIDEFPRKLKEATSNISIEAINWRYRPDGWKLKQVVHHCCDSHLNSIIRYKLALTEKDPNIRPYFEERWAELVDAHDDDLSLSIQLITSLHAKWVSLLKRLSPEDYKLAFFHPEHRTRFTLGEVTGVYAWHCEHHLAHIHLAIKSEGKYN